MRIATLVVLLTLLGCGPSEHERQLEDATRRAYGAVSKLARRGLPAWQEKAASLRADYLRACRACRSSSYCEDEARRISDVGTDAENDVVCR